MPLIHREMGNQEAAIRLPRRRPRKAPCSLDAMLEENRANVDWPKWPLPTSVCLIPWSTPRERRQRAELGVVRCRRFFRAHDHSNHQGGPFFRHSHRCWWKGPICPIWTQFGPKTRTVFRKTRGGEKGVLGWMCSGFPS